MLEFNWGIFWALLAAFAIRGAIKRVWTIVLTRTIGDREITLGDIWERM